MMVRNVSLPNIISIVPKDFRNSNIRLLSARARNEQPKVAYQVFENKTQRKNDVERPILEKEYFSGDDAPV